MLKNKWIVLIILAIIVGACRDLPESDNSPTYRIVEMDRVIEDTAYYSIRMHYPVFSSDDKVENDKLEFLNQEIASFLDTASHYYWGVHTTAIVHFLKETKASGKYELTNKYTILDSTKTLISLKMETYSYAMGAHGFNALHTYNLDLANNKMLKLEDILDLSSKEKNELLNKLLQKNFVDPEDCFNDLPTANKDFELFGLEPGFLVFFYQAYDLGAYSCGEASVRISLDELRDVGLWKADL